MLYFSDTGLKAGRKIPSRGCMPLIILQLDASDETLNEQECRRCVAVEKRKERSVGC